MNFQQLDTFRWIARLRSFGRAAHKLNATQSTVSMRMADLEKELGIILLDRTRRIVRVTPKGRDLLRYAEEIALLVSEIRHEVGDSRKMSGTLRIGVAELIAMTWLPKLMHSIKTTYPFVDAELQVGLGSGMLTLLDAGDLDLVLMPQANQVATMLRADSLGSVRFGFVAAKELVLSAKILTPATLVEQTLITHGETSALHRLLMQWCGHGNVQPTRIITSNSMEASAMLASAGLGVTFLPLAYYEPWVNQQRLQRISARPAIPPIEFSAISPPGRQSPLVDAIVRQAVQHSTFTKGALEPEA